MRLFILLCSDLAIRSTTAAGIAPKHYNPETRILAFVTKFGTTQQLPVTDEIAAIFAYVGQDLPDVPFCVRLHPMRRITPRSLRNAFADARRRAGIKRNVTLHDLRRTTANVVYGVTDNDLRAVQALLGHKQLQTTLHYLDYRIAEVSKSVLELAKLNVTTEVVQ